MEGRQADDTLFLPPELQIEIAQCLMRTTCCKFVPPSLKEDIMVDSINDTPTSVIRIIQTENDEVNNNITLQVARTWRIWCQLNKNLANWARRVEIQEVAKNAFCVVQCSSRAFTRFRFCALPDGTRHGLYQSYNFYEKRNRGNEIEYWVNVEGIYKNGKREGVWCKYELFYPDKQFLQNVTTFVNGIPCGIFESFALNVNQYPRCRTRIKGAYNQGQLCGRWRVGTKVLEQQYKQIKDFYKEEIEESINLLDGQH